MNRWQIKPMGKAAETVMGQAPKGDETNFEKRGIPFVKAGEFGPHRPVIREWTTNPLKIAKSSDVFICVVGATAGKLNLGTDCAIGRSVAAIRPNPSILNQGFLYYFLQGWTLRLRSGSQGSAQRVLTQDMLQSIPIPLPPLAEQERIVKLLDETDELRKLRSQADQRTAKLIPALFHEMFGDPTYLEKMRWPFQPVGEFASVSYGLADKLDASTHPEDGTRILTISNVLIDGSIDTEVERYSLAGQAERAKAKLQNLDLLFNWRNGSEEHVGKTAIWENQVNAEVLHVSFLLRIRADHKKADPYFLWALLNRLRATGYFTRNARMQINRKFNASELSALKLPLPPLPLQNEFANRVKEIRELESTQAASRQRLEDLFQSLLHRAFNGEL